MKTKIYIVLVFFDENDSEIKFPVINNIDFLAINLFSVPRKGDSFIIDTKFDSLKPFEESMYRNRSFSAEESDNIYEFLKSFKTTEFIVHNVRYDYCGGVDLILKPKV